MCGRNGRVGVQPVRIGPLPGRSGGARGPEFEDPVQVPEGFPGHSMLVPHPGEEALYVKLRDNPTAIHAVQLKTVIAEAPPPAT